MLDACRNANEVVFDKITIIGRNSAIKMSERIHHNTKILSISWMSGRLEDAESEKKEMMNIVSTVTKTKLDSSLKILSLSSHSKTKDMMVPLDMQKELRLHDSKFIIECMMSSTAASACL